MLITLQSIFYFSKTLLEVLVFMPNKIKNIIINGIEMKECSKCNKFKLPTSEYFRERKIGNGLLMAECKECEKKRNKKFREINKEVRNKYCREFRKFHKEYVYKYNKSYREINDKNIKEYRVLRRDIDKEWREKNSDSIKIRKRVYYLKNKELILYKNKLRYQKTDLEVFRRNGKKYRQTDKGKLTHILTEQKRRALKKELSHDFTKKDWEEVRNFFRNSDNVLHCAYCDKQIIKAHQEHIIPVTNQGGYTRNNIIPSCQSCNCSKGDQDMEAWYCSKQFFSVQRLEKIIKWINQ